MSNSRVEKEIQKINSLHSVRMLTAMANEDIDAMKVEMELYIYNISKWVSEYGMSLEIVEPVRRLLQNDYDALKLMELTKESNIDKNSPSQVWSDIGTRLAKGARQVIENELG